MRIWRYSGLIHAQMALTRRVEMTASTSMIVSAVMISTSDGRGAPVFRVRLRRCVCTRNFAPWRGKRVIWPQHALVNAALTGAQHDLTGNEPGSGLG